MSDFPSFTDGRRGVKDPVVTNLMTGTVYHYIKDSFKVGGRAIDHELEGEGDHLGSDTKSSGCEKGVLNIQLNKATDDAPQVAHVLKVVKGTSTKYYVVTEEPHDMERNNVVRLGVPLTQVVNPFFSALVSAAEGDTYRKTHSKAQADWVFPTLPVNHRTGSTKAYSATQSDGSAVPAGFVINAGTGIITVTSATIAIGVYTIKVVGTDVLAPYTDREGEATLELTVTA